jgi:hypothetical protein
LLLALSLQMLGSQFQIIPALPCWKHLKTIKNPQIPILVDWDILGFCAMLCDVRTLCSMCAYCAFGFLSEAGQWCRDAIRRSANIGWPRRCKVSVKPTAMPWA